MQTVTFDEIDFTQDAYWRIDVTPSIARKMLARNVNNNRLPKRRKEQYARDMREGKWVTGTGETLKFNTDGKLFDGANRLRGVVISGKTITMDVKTGAPVTAMLTVDDIAARSNGDAIKISLNIPDPNNAAAISNIVQLLHNGAYNVGTHVGINSKPTRQEVVKFVELNQEQVRKAIAIGRRAGNLKVKNMGPRCWFVCYWLTSLMDKEKADEFYTSVCEMDGIASEFVEDILLKDPETGKQKSYEWVIYRYVRTFDRLMMGNNHRTGRTPEEIAKAYRETFREYVDHMKECEDTGFTFLDEA